MTAGGARAMSDLQFTGSYRVPFQFSPYLREHLSVGAFVQSPRA
jgi:glutamate-1-semialdehyde 2,1-aminomutase